MGLKNNIEKNIFLSSLGLKKKSLHSKKTMKFVSELKNSINEKQKYKKFEFVSSHNKNGSVISYVIYFSFSRVNTFLYVTDALGNLKFRYSAGLVDFKGKQKKNRLQVLNRFFSSLKKLKMSLLKNKPIAIHLHNVGSYKYFIVKKLKKFFFVRFIKSYQTYPYNGCRKKKRLRKK